MVKYRIEKKAEEGTHQLSEQQQPKKYYQGETLGQEDEPSPIKLQKVENIQTSDSKKND